MSASRAICCDCVVLLFQQSIWLQQMCDCPSRTNPWHWKSTQWELIMSELHKHFSKIYRWKLLDYCSSMTVLLMLIHNLWISIYKSVLEHQLPSMALRFEQSWLAIGRTVHPTFTKLVQQTWSTASFRSSLQVCDPDHTHSLPSIQ